MSRIAFFVSVVCLTFKPIASGDEPSYHLTLETIHLADEKAKDGTAESIVLRSVQTTVYPGLRFRVRSKMGTETLIVAGSLMSRSADRHRIEIEYRHSVSRDPAESAGKKRIGTRVDDETSVASTVDVRLGERFELAKQVHAIAQDRPSTVSHVLTLSTFDE